MTDYESEEDKPLALPASSKDDGDAPDAGIREQINKFERRNAASEAHNSDFIKQTRENQRWASGKIVSHPDEFGDNSDEDTLRANLIHSTNQAMLPHIYAQDPEPSVQPAEMVNPVDGESEGGVYTSIKPFSETARIVMKKQFNIANIKRAAKKALLKVQTSGATVFKVSYQKDYFSDPIIRNRIDETTQDIAQIQGLSQQVDESNDPNAREGRMSELHNALKSLKAQEKRLVADNIAIDVLPFKSFRWDPSVPFTDLQQSIWMAHYVWRNEDELKDDYGFDEDRIARLSAYATTTNRAYTGHKAISGDGNTDESESKQYRLWELWDKRTSGVYTWVEGDNQWCKGPVYPNYMGDRWYPFFEHYDHELDDADFPLSDVELLIPLQREYDETRKQLSEHRQAAIPAIMVDASKADKDSVVKVAKAGMRDFIFVDTNGAPMRDMFYPGPSTPLNPGVYDVTPIMADIQWVSGLQDADRGGVVQAKTLGEAEIMQRGLANRTSTRRDMFEDVLSDMYSFGFYMILEHCDYATIIKLSGEHAFWPQHEESKEQYKNMVNVKIRAGSTGRPDEAKELKTWMESLDVVMGLTEKIMIARQNGMQDQDNPHYLILEMTLKKLDERVDMEEFLPKPKQQPTPTMPAPGLPGMMDGSGQPGGAMQGQSQNMMPEQTVVTQLTG